MQADLNFSKPELINKSHLCPNVRIKMIPDERYIANIIIPSILFQNHSFYNDVTMNSV